MSLQIIDWRKLAVMLLPTCLRAPRLTALVRVLMQPIVELSDRRTTLRSDTLFQLQHTGQVVYLRHALNKQFGYDRSNGFEIEDIAADGEFLMLYDEGSNQGYMIALAADQQAIEAAEPQSDWLWAWDENTIWATTDFIVWCPAAVYADANSLAQVRSIVNRYRLLSRIPDYRQLN